MAHEQTTAFISECATVLNWQKGFFLVLSITLCSAAQATTYTVVGAAPGNNKNIVHDAVFGKIRNISGTYDDATGDLDLSFTIKRPNRAPVQVDFSSDNMFFNWHGRLKWPGALADAEFSRSIAGKDSAEFYFKPRLYSGGWLKPNTFRPVPGEVGLFQLTLWGETTSPFKWHKDLGIDLAVRLQAVPIPGAILLFATALFGLVGLRRRQQASV